jgi:hypothetical protein
VTRRFLTETNNNVVATLQVAGTYDEGPPDFGVGRGPRPVACYGKGKVTAMIAKNLDPDSHPARIVSRARS